MTPKQQVLAKYPSAYAIKYDSGAFEVYEAPLTAAPRGHVNYAKVIGYSDLSFHAAWADAARRLKERK